MSDASHLRVIRSALDQGLAIWRGPMREFVKRELHKEYGDHWADHVERPWHPRTANPLDDPELLDPSALLSIVRNQWDPVFNRRFSFVRKEVFEDIRRGRNEWAHLKTIDVDDAQRWLKSMALVLHSISAHQEATRIEHLIQQLPVDSHATDQSVVARLTAGLESIGFRDRVEHFVTEYLGTAEAPMCFGGRSASLAGLDAWLSDSAAPTGLLIAPAGRGKSALLVQWAARILDLGRADIVFVPISIRFDTCQWQDTLKLLGAYLARHMVWMPPPYDPDIWASAIADLLRRDRPIDTQPLLLILDGLDEMLGVGDGRLRFLPSNLGRGVRVLASARLLANCDADGWCGRLNWPVMRTHRFDLATLDEAGISEALLSLGSDFAELANQQPFLTELLRLTEGDPLLVRFYIDELQQQRAAETQLTSLDLAAIKPGLSAYLDRWWEDQRRIWGGESPLREPSVRLMISLLACACGPLRRDDLLALGEPERLDTWLIDEAIRTLRRLVVGDGDMQGYVFTHPRLAGHFYARLHLSERSRWEQRFLDYCSEVLVQVRAGQRTPANVPVYVLRAHGQHLIRAGGELAQSVELISYERLRAWEAHDATFEGYADDLDTVRELADRGLSVSTSDVELAVALQCRTLLLQASLNSLGDNLAPDLIPMLVQERVWRPQQALAYISSTADEARRTEQIASIAHLLSHHELRAALDDCMRGMIQPVHRLRACTILATRLPEPERTTVLRDILVMAQDVVGSINRARILLTIAPHLSDEVNLHAALREALWTLNYEQQQPIDHALLWYAHLEEPLQWLIQNLPDELLDEALARFEVLPQLLMQHKVAELLVCRLDSEQAARVYALACQSLSNEREIFVSLLRLLVPKLPAELRSSAIDRILVGLTTTLDFVVPPILSELLPYFDERHIPAALTLARRLLQRDMRLDKVIRVEMVLEGLPAADTISELITILAALLPADMISELIAEVRRVGDPINRIYGLHWLAARLDSSEREKLLNELRREVGTIPDAPTRLWVLSTLIPELIGKEREDAIEAVRAATLALPVWNEEFVRSVLHRMRSVHSSSGTVSEHDRADWEQYQASLSRSAILTNLVSYLPISERHNLLQEVLNTWHDQEIYSAWVWQGHGLVRQLLESGDIASIERLCQSLPLGYAREDKRIRALDLAIMLVAHDDRLSGIVRDLLAAVEQIDNPSEQVRLLIDLANVVDAPLRMTVLTTALKNARYIGDHATRADLMVDLAPTLLPERSEPVLRETLRILPALHARSNIMNRDVYEKALDRLIPNLPNSLLGAVLDQVRDCVDSVYLADMLGELIPRLPEDMLDSVLELIRELEALDRGEPLRLLVPRLTDTALRRLLIETSQLDPLFDGDWLASLIGRLRDVTGELAVQTDIAAIPRVRDRIVALRTYAMQLPRAAATSVAHSALALAGSIEDVSERTAALAMFVPLLDGPERRAASIEVIEGWKSLGSDPDWLSLRSGVLQSLPIDLIGPALEIVSRTRYGTVSSLELLLPRLPTALFHDAVTIARGLSADVDRCRALAAIARLLVGDAREELLEEALSALDSAASRSAGASQVVHPGVVRAMLYADAAMRHILGDPVPPLSQSVMIPDWLRVLRELIPELPEKTLPLVIDILRRAHPDMARAQALVGIASSMRESLRSALLMAAIDIDNPTQRAVALAGLAPYLNGPERQLALDGVVELLEAIENERDQAALGRVLAAMDCPRYADTLVNLARRESIFAHALMLVAVIPHVPVATRASLCEEVLNLAIYSCGPDLRAETLAHLAPALAQLPRPELIRLWIMAIDELKYHSRAHALECVQSLIPVIDALGGPTALTALGEAVTDAGRWFG